MTDPSPTTLAEALEAAPSTAAELVFHLGQDPVHVPAATLLARARAGAAVLADVGVRAGDPVGILGPNGPEWARWAYATWLAGGIVVPIPYHLRVPDEAAFRAQVGALVGAAGCRTVLADPRFLPLLPLGVGMRWDAEPASTPRAPLHEPQPEDLAVIQFTSGSTAAPKGAALTHRAILAGVRNTSAGSGHEAAGWVQLSWLPFFHDWGLFGYLVWSMVEGTEAHIMPTERFARDPSEWLRLAGSVRAQITPGPSSAWDAAMRVASRRPDGIDLSTLRVCTLAAEAIEPRVVERVIELGSGFGLDPNAVNGAYGMAEATLAVTLGSSTTPIRIDAVDRTALVSSGLATPADGGPEGKRVVSCGRTVPGAEVRIAGPEGPLPDRRVGEILLRGPSLMEGYVGRGHDDPFVEGWMHTGDLGYMADGELFVTGRMKDVVIVLGRNYPAQDLEWAAERVSGVRAGRTVAFATGEVEGEAVVVVETRAEQDVDDLPRRVWRVVADSVGVVPREILVLPGGSIPLTTSGKLRRSWVREAYARGDLDGLAVARGPARTRPGVERVVTEPES